MFWTQGNCREGKNCAFAHPKGGGQQMQGTGQVCKFWTTKGSCSFGAQCKFDHPKGQKGKGGMAMDVDDDGAAGRSGRHSPNAAAAAAASPHVTVVIGESVAQSARKRRHNETGHERQCEEEPQLLKEIRLNEESMRQITDLFNIMDINSDGFLSTEDFERWDQVQKFRDLRLRFDTSGDGKVDIQEFREGIKKYALACPGYIRVLPDPSTPLYTWIKHINDVTNVMLQTVCAEIYQNYVL